MDIRFASWAVWIGSRTSWDSRVVLQKGILPRNRCLAPSPPPVSRTGQRALPSLATTHRHLQFTDTHLQTDQTRTIVTHSLYHRTETDRRERLEELFGALSRHTAVLNQQSYRISLTERATSRFAQPHRVSPTQVYAFSPPLPLTPILYTKFDTL